MQGAVGSEYRSVVGGARRERDMGKNQKRWRCGDLVLLSSDHKTHATLREILEIKGARARTAYLDRGLRARAAKGQTDYQGEWHSIRELNDPALFLRTEEYLETLREREENRRNQT